MTRPAIGPIVKMPVEVQATDALRESIVTGSIAPGSRITEINLAEQMGLSRATVRTALHQLAKEGLIILVPYTGWKVVGLSARDVWELYTLRSAIERLAGRLVAAALHDGKDAVKIRTLNRAFDHLVAQCRRDDRRAIAEADFALHKAIIGLAEHARLAAQYGLIEQQIRMYIRTSDDLVERSEQIIDQHRPIIDAILAGDVEEAGRRSEIHNVVEGEKLSAHLARLEPPVEARTAKPSRPRPRKSA